MTSAKAQRQKKKTRTWTTPTILGLILSVVGALSIVELKPQISVSPQPERANNVPFSAPFEITNTGYLGFHVDNVVVVLPLVEYQGGKITFHDSKIGNVDWDNFDLDRGVSKTIYPTFSNGVPQKASLVIAMDYRYLGIKCRFLRRFDGTHMDNWQWGKQPIKTEDEPSLNRLVDEAIAQHKEASGQRP
jgi:hypothetical protein